MLLHKLIFILTAYAVVQLGDTSERNLIEVYGLLLHKAVHVWQKIKKLMGEREPSVEFEAYSIQAIAQDLFKMYEESEVNDGMEGGKSQLNLVLMWLKQQRKR